MRSERSLSLELSNLESMKQFFKYLTLVVLISLAIFIYSGTYFDLSRSDLETKYATDASKFLNTNDGKKVHYKDEGNLEKPAIVLLHGFNGSLFNFDKLIPLLKDNYRLISIDLPGFGLTGPIPSADYTNDSFMQTVSEVTQFLNIEEFSIAGNSMGGGVAWRYAIKYPNKITGLILLSSSGVLSIEERKAFESSKKDTPIAWKLMRSDFSTSILSHFTPKFFATQGLKASVFDQKLATKELAYQFHDLTLMSGSRSAILSMFNNRINKIYEAEDLKKIRAPTLVIHGEEDNIIPYQSSSKFKQLIKEVELNIYPKIGHLPMYENPERTARDIDRFLSSRL